MSIKTELLAIKADDELLLVDNVIVAARSSPETYPDLHNRLFSRTDAELAEDQRRHIVRQLIAVHIVEDEGHRALISLTIDRSNQGGGYRSLNDVLPRVDLREIMLADALRDLDRLQQKYNRLNELAEVWSAKEKVRTKTRRRGRRPRPDDRPSASP
jgi:hypothetical protein